MDYKTPVKKILIAAVLFLSVLLVVLAAPNPIGDWRFEEGTGTTTADSSGNGKTGTLINGASWTTSGAIGSAVNFDGANDRISLPSNSAPVQMTVIAWIYPRNLGGANAGNIFAIRSTSQANTFLAVNSINKLKFVSTFSNAGVNKIGSWYTPTNSIALSEWQQVAVTYNASNPSNDPVFYINGQQVSTVDNVQPSGVFKTGATPWSIGNNPGLSNGFNGFIDEVRVYNQILSPADILSIYNADVTPTIDTQPPTVVITSPADGSLVSGVINIDASATDDVGVVAVQFDVDGAILGEDMTTPYSMLWDSRSSSNDIHTITAVARDAAGNTTSNSITVNVSNIVTNAPLPLFDHFTYFDTNTWTPITANAGSLNIVDSYAECSSPSSVDACAFYYNAKIDKTQNQLWVFSISDHSGIFPQQWVSLVNSPTTPTAETLSSLNPKLRARIGTETNGPVNGIVFEHWTNTHAQRQWNSATNLWNSPMVFANSPVKGDDYYLVGLEIDGQNGRWRMLSWHRRSTSTSFSLDQGLRLFAVSDWINWSSMEATDDLWLVVGEPITDGGAGTMRVEWIRADTGVKQHVWSNGRLSVGHPYSIKHSWGYPSVNGIVEFMVPQDRTTVAVGKGPTGSWDSDGVKDVNALYDPADGMYYLVYRSLGSASTNISIGYSTSTSPDGPWTKFSGNPIIVGTPNSLEPYAGAPNIIKDMSEPDPNKRYKIFYGSRSSGFGRTFWAAAPAMAGPWVKQGLFMDTIGQVPGGIDEAGRSGFNPVLYNGVYYLVVGAKPSDPTSPSGMSYSYGTDLMNLTHSQTLLVPYRATPAQNLTGNLNGRILTVTDTTGYVADGYIEISNNNGQNSGTRIRKVIDGTTIELYHGLDGFTTLNKAKIIQVDGANRIGPSYSPMYRNGKWYVYMTPFNFFGQYQGQGYGNFENIGLVSSNGIDQPYTWNHLATPTLMRESWNHKISNENPSILHTDIETVVI